MSLGDILRVVGIGTAAYGLERMFKSEYKKLDDVAETNKESQEDENYEDEIYKKVKIDRKKYCDNVRDNSAFLKKLYSGMRFNPRFDIDYFNVVDAMNSDFTITVKRGDKPGTTEIQCGLTDFTQTSRNDPKVPDYIRCIKNSIKEISDTWNDQLIKVQSLFVYLRYTDQKGSDVEIKVPKSVYSDWATEKHDGAVEFYTDFIYCEDNAKKAVLDWINNNNIEVQPNSVFINLSYSIIMSNQVGIIPMMDVIEKILNTEIIRGNNGNSYRYEYVLVLAPNKSGVIDYDHAYDVEDDKVIILDLTDDDND